MPSELALLRRKTKLRRFARVFPLLDQLPELAGPAELGILGDRQFAAK